MRVKVRLMGKVWEAVALDGLFKGKTVMLCDGIALSACRVAADEVSGNPIAVWGAELDDTVAGHPHTVRQLGVAKRFPVRGFGPDLSITPGGGAFCVSGEMHASLATVVCLNGRMYAPSTTEQQL